MAQRQTGVVTQSLLEATLVEMSPDTAALIEESLEVLKGLGFDIEQFGGSSFLLRGLPALLGNINPSKAIHAVADDLERGDNPLEQTIEDRIVTRICKTAAVKAGQILSQKEMEAMIRQLEASSAPFTCPHGRPTMIEMSSEQLAKLFGRI
jgi:DNA mismatch repair protein MutL